MAPRKRSDVGLPDRPEATRPRFPGAGNAKRCATGIAPRVWFDYEGSRPEARSTIKALGRAPRGGFPRNPSLGGRQACVPFPCRGAVRHPWAWISNLGGTAPLVRHDYRAKPRRTRRKGGGLAFPPRPLALDRFRPPGYHPSFYLYTQPRRPLTRGGGSRPSAGGGLAIRAVSAVCAEPRSL